MFFDLRKGHKTPLALVWVGYDIAKTGSLLLPACDMLRSDFVACDSSCIPLRGSLMFRFLPSPILKRGQKQASLLLSFLPALVSCTTLCAFGTCLGSLYLYFDISF